MTTRKKIAGCILAAAVCDAALAEDAINSAFENGSVNGNVRAHYNTREYDHRTDEAAFALGGALRAETGYLGMTKFGVGFYTAQDLDMNSDDPAEVNGRLGSELEVLGEAYITFSAMDSALTLGRQKVNTPLANPGDAFIVPFTFEAYSLKTASLGDFTFEVDYLNTIKNRNSEDFVDVGVWSSSRYGIESTDTSGTLILGGIYKKDAVDLHAWYYNFSDLFDTYYFQAGWSFAEGDVLKPFIGAQMGMQSETGDELLGTVDSTLYGLELGAGFNRAKVSFSYNRVSEQDDAFLNGAFLAPYSFSTSPLFTNNMLETLENVDAGDAMKLTFFYNFPAVALKVSHAVFDFKNVVDRDATDVDITYDMEHYVPGLLLRWRMEIVSADAEVVEQTNHRFQLHYNF